LIKRGVNFVKRQSLTILFWFLVQSFDFDTLERLS